MRPLTHAAEPPRPCPICHDVERRVLHPQRFVGIEGVSTLGGYDVVACARCGACFADGIPPQSVFDDYYREFSKYENATTLGATPEFDRQRFTQSAEDLVGSLPSRDLSVLEIGASTGAFLSALKAQGFHYLLGLDPSALCASIAREMHGVDIHQGSLFNHDIDDRQFDVVALLHVLEHIADVPAAVERLRALTRPGGVVCIEVPDADSFVRSASQPFQQFSVEHINFFSGRSLQALMAAHGFECRATMRRVRSSVSPDGEGVVMGVFARTDTPRTPTFEGETAASIERYVTASAEADRPIRDALERLKAVPALVVWGCGTLTQRLLASSALGALNISAFIDSNPRYHGRTLHGAPINGPASLVDHREPVLVSTLGHCHAIRQQIRAFGCDNEIFTLRASE